MDLLERLRVLDVHVHVEKGRVRVNAPKGSITPELEGALVAHRDDLRRMLEGPNNGADLGPVPRGESLPLSFFQERLWLGDQLEPGSTRYNLAALLGPRAANVEHLTRAVRQVLSRHEILRSRFVLEGDAPVVHLGSSDDAPLPITDLRDKNASERQQLLNAAMAEAVRIPFDLAAEGPIRFHVFRTAPEEATLLVSAHHIAVDSWSFAVLAREIWSAYDALAASTPPAPPPALQYADFAHWQRRMMERPGALADLTYWKKRLSGVPELSIFPPDHQPGTTGHSGGAAHPFEWPVELCGAVRTLARECNATMYMVLLAGVVAVLHKRTGQTDLAVGCPLGTRDKAELEGMIGPILNPIVLRFDLSDDPTFAQLVEQARVSVLEGHLHKDVPFERVVQEIAPRRSRSHPPLFQIAVVLHNAPDVTSVTLASGGSIFDLTLFARERGLTLEGAFEYRSDLYHRDTIRRISADIDTLLATAASDRTLRISELPQSAVGLSAMSDDDRRQVSADADQRPRDIPPLSADEECTLLNQLNATALPHDRSQCVHDLFAEVAARTPDAVAVVAEDGTLTYAVLEERANQLAHLLRSRGVRTGALVAVCVDRTSNLPVALLGVLKAGAAYVPLDPLHPPERLLSILRDAQVTCVVTDAQSGDAVVNAQMPVVRIGTNGELLAAQPVHPPEVVITSRDLAYVIYTSGSTGTPKGVELEHRNLVSLLRAMQREPGIGPDDVLLAVTTPSFDIAGLELFLPLVSGARTVIATRDEVFDGDRLWQRMASCHATMMQATPATWRLLLETGWPGKTDLTALCGGEALPRDLAGTLSSRVHALWNMYGPTETTIWSTVHHVTDCSGSIPIGHAIANTTVFVLDPAGCQTPIGVTGELCIGGEGVGRGYHGRAELTAEKFVMLQRPGRMPERVYRTGDLVRLRSDLALEFVGRRDHQTKIRGHRIELGEIEAVLAEHPFVRRTAVKVHAIAAGDERLVAYVVLAQGTDAIDEELRTLLRSRLPDYMVPSTIVFLDALPLTPNGKIDRNALPAPEASQYQEQSTYVEPRTPTEKLIAGVWAEVLHVGRVGVTDNFFHLGGHSLLVTRMMARLKAALGVELPLRMLFDAPTVAELAERVSATRITAESPRWNCLVPIQTRGANPPLFVVAGYNFEDETMLILSRLIPHLGSDQPIYGLRPRWLERDQSAYDTVDEMARESLGELRAIQPHGPYLLAGLCIASSVAIEIARLLTQQGEDVRLLAMIDAGRPCRLRSVLYRLEQPIGRVVGRATHMVGVIRELLSADRRRRKALVLEVFHRKFGSAAAASAERHEGKRLHELRARHTRLLVDHRHEPYEGDITEIASEEYHRFNRYMGWSPIIKGGVTFHKLPGDHETLLTQHMGTVAHLLRIGMDSARSQSVPVADGLAERRDLRPFRRLRPSSTVQALLCWISATGALIMM